MTSVTLACRNMLVNAPEVKALVTQGLLAKSPTFPEGWVFADRPHGALEEASHKALVVVTREGGWQSPNEHNRAKFPRLRLDIWAAPTKDSRLAVLDRDADDVIDAVIDAVLPHMHTVDKAVPGRVGGPATFLGEPGGYRWWGTPAEVLAKTALPVVSSELLEEPEYFDADFGEGSRMASLWFGLIH